MSDSITYIIAAFLLIFIFAVSVLSIRDDSLTMDESAHLPAGYSYLTQMDMRLNPEHPPLLKDLSAVPLLFIKDIKFPSETKAWKEDVNGQWTFGWEFLFKNENPAEKMIFWGRIPVILLLVILGFYVFIWTRQTFGNTASLISLFLFSFSPTLLAHGRLVTTDVGAAAGVFIASYYFIKFLFKIPLNGSLGQAIKTERKSLIKAGIALGAAQLLKFSLILIFPFFIILIFLWAITKATNFKSYLKNLGRYLIFFVLISLVAFLLIWLVYQYHVWNYPPERQARDTEFILASFNQDFAKIAVWLADKPVLRPAAQYLLGLFMIFQRASGGNTGYFWGEVSAAGWKIYFPFVYLVKETLVFHILSVISILYLIWLIQKSLRKRPLKMAFNWLKYHFVEISALIFIGIYWTVSLKSNLNIGVRHLLPVFPFTILLVGGMTSYFFFKTPFPRIKKAILFWLILWQIYSVLAVFPHFLAYFNELVGGPNKGYLYAVDSNLDWGQDLKRLKIWLDKENIDKIYIDYFGGSAPEYYLEEKYLPWRGDQDSSELPEGSYLAVSATLLQGGRGKPVPGFNQSHSYYKWLDKYQPIAKIGYSIFVYRID